MTYRLERAVMKSDTEKWDSRIAEIKFAMDHLNPSSPIEFALFLLLQGEGERQHDERARYLHKMIKERPVQ
jgi:hypothetical protein